MTKGNLSDRMNHIGLFIPIIIVISYLIKFILNLLFFDIFPFSSEYNKYYYIIYLAFIYFIFNLLGFILRKDNEIETIELPIVIPSIIEFLKRKRILTFILLYFLCQIEKLFWEIFFGIKSIEYFGKKEELKDNSYHAEDIIAFIIFFPPILFGFIFDKFDFSGFKWIIYTGSIINVLSCIYCFNLFSKGSLIIADNYVFFLSIINEIFRAGNYAIFLPEIIKKFEIKNLLILSGIVSASNFFVQPLEVILTKIFEYENFKTSNPSSIKNILIIQICCSIIIFLLFFFRGINENLGMEKLGEITEVKGRDILLKFNEESDEGNETVIIDNNISKIKGTITEMNTKNNTSYNLIEE